MASNDYYKFPNPEPIPANEVQPLHIVRHLSFNRGSVVKYVSRAGRKPGEDELKDLLKAQDLLADEIALVRERGAKPEEATEIIGFDPATNRLAARRPDGTMYFLPGEADGWRA